LFSVDALAYLGPRPLGCRVGDDLVLWSFRWKRLRPLGLSRTATLLAWEPAGQRELTGRLASVMVGLDGGSWCQVMGFRAAGPSSRRTW
jgi:hypothetical protein